jgi:transcriptional regulator with XRE-family HTH domain
MKNERLRKARKERRWTIEEACERIGVSRTTYIRWEQGTQKPQDLLLTWACKAFNMTAEQLGFAEWPDRRGKPESQETTIAFPAAQNMQPEQSSPVIRLTREQAEWIAKFLGLRDKTMTPTDLSRRAALINILKAAGIAVAAAPLLEAEPWERLERALKKPSSIDTATLDHLALLAEQTWQFIPEVAGAVSRHSLNYVLEHLHTVTDLLEGSHPTPVYRQLCCIAAELALVAGVILAAMKNYPSARHYYDVSTHAARESGAPALEAIGLARKSFTLTYSDQVEQALPLVQEAFRLSPPDSTERYWIAAILAEVHANMGQANASFRALKQAKPITNYVRPEDPYRTAFDRFLLAGYESVCLLRLKRPDEAQAILRETLEHPTLPSVYIKSNMLTDLASIHLQQGDISGSFTYAAEALQITALTKSPSMFQYLVDFRHQLKSGQGTVEVRQFDEQLQFVSPLIDRVRE